MGTEEFRMNEKGKAIDARPFFAIPCFVFGITGFPRERRK